MIFYQTLLMGQVAYLGATVSAYFLPKDTRKASSCQFHRNRADCIEEQDNDHT